MTKEFIYKNIKKLEQFAKKHSEIKEFDEIIIKDESRGTKEKTNYYIMFTNGKNYTEIFENDDNNITIITFRTKLDEEDKEVGVIDTTEIKQDDFFKEFK